MGARRLPAAQATLLGSAEMPMGPLWVWLFFNEMPATETFAGGALVLAAILGNIVVELRARPTAETALSGNPVARLISHTIRMFDAQILGNR